MHGRTFTGLRSHGDCAYNAYRQRGIREFVTWFALGRDAVACSSMRIIFAYDDLLYSGEGCNVTAVLLCVSSSVCQHHASAAALRLPAYGGDHLRGEGDAGFLRVPVLMATTCLRVAKIQHPVSSAEHHAFTPEESVCGTWNSWKARAYRSCGSRRNWKRSDVFETDGVQRLTAYDRRMEFDHLRWLYLPGNMDGTIPTISDIHALSLGSDSGQVFHVKHRYRETGAALIYGRSSGAF